MYKIFVTHNRPWTVMELTVFFIVFVIVTGIAVQLVRKNKILVSQAVAGELLFVFIAIVLASTIFTRKPTGMHNYQLIPFWSWRAIVLGNKELLKENLLNMILLLPAGFLLPFVFRKKIAWRTAFLTGALFSFCIELGQLILCRGLFEWDDLVHNSIGALVGCLLANKMMKKRWG